MFSKKNSFAFTTLQGWVGAMKAKQGHKLVLHSQELKVFLRSQVILRQKIYVWSIVALAGSERYCAVLSVRRQDIKYSDVISDLLSLSLS